jgi:hypothetical protein
VSVGGTRSSAAIDCSSHALRRSARVPAAHSPATRKTGTYALRGGVTQDRTVLADNTFSLKNIRFEAPRDLRSRKIQVRFDRARFDRVVVFFKGERMGEARPLDAVANDRKPTTGTKNRTRSGRKGAKREDAK